MCEGECISCAMGCGCQGKAGRGAFLGSACLPASPVSKPTGEKPIVENSLQVIPISIPRVTGSEMSHGFYDDLCFVASASVFRPLNGVECDVPPSESPWGSE